MSKDVIKGRSLVNGTAAGALLFSETGLSIWGGVDPATGIVIDQHHQLNGENLSGKILAIPSGRGSCSGSGALLELMLNDCAPAALVFSQAEEILTLGVLVAKKMFERTIPVLCIDPASFTKLHSAGFAQIHDNQMRLFDTLPADVWTPEQSDLPSISDPVLQLTDDDLAQLEGDQGRAAKVAMQIIIAMAGIQGAEKLIDITQAHIDACIYNGPSSLRFAQQLLEWEARVRVPTTLNSLSVDKRQWQQQGVASDFGQAASDLGDAYINMGAQISFTCAPYLLDTAPMQGEQIVWAESNAVVFANSVIGARTQKYPDFLDICIALTGRAPACGCHLDAARLPTLCINVAEIANADDALWPTLGYHVGLRAGNELPIIYGLENSSPSLDDLKAFSAAFATTSSTPMFHIAGVTPESAIASEHAELFDCSLRVSAQDLLGSWWDLNTASESRIELISLGNPHFSLTECESLLDLCKGRQKDPAVQIVATLGRAVYASADSAGYIGKLRDFGVEFITDTCWCMIQEPVIASSVRTLMTNSAKYAHYAPGLVGREVHFGSLSQCVEAACSGKRSATQPAWFSPLI